MQTFVPSYLEQSMHAFSEQQNQIREHMAKTLGDTPLAKNLQVPMQLMEEQIKRNTEIFRQAMEVFTPFGAATQKPEAKKTEAKDIEELKEQLRALQTKIENM
jgi:polyhydroxyalkanoate synthesis regulator protein